MSMPERYSVTGTVSDATTVKLDESLPVSSGRVRVTVEVSPDLPITNGEVSSYHVVMEGIRQRQQARGHIPPTDDEVAQYIRSERKGWE